MTFDMLSCGQETTHLLTYLFVHQDELSFSVSAALCFFLSLPLTKNPHLASLLSYLTHGIPQLLYPTKICK